MNSDFSKNITLRRKEKNLSQKQAAADLGISQALLSHYEKGIRECGLDFLLKISEYYNVSCDELLGRNKASENNMNSGSAADSIDITEAVRQLLAEAEKSGDSHVAAGISNCLMMTVYKLMRIIRCGEEKNFSLSEESAISCADAVIALNEAETEESLRSSGKPQSGMNGCLADIAALSERAILKLRDAGK